MTRAILALLGIASLLSPLILAALDGFRLTHEGEFERWLSGASFETLQRMERLCLSGFLLLAEAILKWPPL